VTQIKDFCREDVNGFESGRHPIVYYIDLSDVMKSPHFHIHHPKKKQECELFISEYSNVVRYSYA
jgi:hypothetical protein